LVSVEMQILTRSIKNRTGLSNSEMAVWASFYLVVL
jgi:hypothetical protein